MKLLKRTISSFHPPTQTALGRTYNYKSSVGYTYTYDANGNILTAERTDTTRRVTSVPDPDPNQPVEMSLSEESELQSVTTGTTNYMTTYTYDEAGQLLSAVDEETGCTYRYTYDDSGNLQTMKTYTTDEDGEETLVSSKTLHYTNGILSSYNTGTASGVAYVTDAMGNPTSIRRGTRVLTSFTWGEGRSLTGYTCGTTSATYSYDQNGLRVSKSVTEDDTTATTNYIWGDNGLAGTVCGSDKVIVHYDSEGEPIGFSLNGTVYTYIKNLQGDIVRILDAEKTTVVSYTYDPWGVPTVTGDTDLAAVNPCTYRGYYYDQETGYYYLQSRYYDPTLGRFLNADDEKYIGTSSNMVSDNIYSYCANDPTNRIDPSGYFYYNHCYYPNYKINSVGFDVNMYVKFLGRNYCQNYASLFLYFEGVRGYYAGMNKLRIAQELWAHALAHYVGVLLKKVLTRIGIPTYWINDLILSHTSVINVDNTDNRAWIFSMVWWSAWWIKYHIILYNRDAWWTPYLIV